MNLIVIVGCILGSWAILLLMSGERYKRLRTIELSIKAAEEDAARKKKDRERPIEVR